MTFHHYMLPRLPSNLYINLDVQTSQENPQPVISESLSYYLIDIKQQIDVYEQQWESYKKYTNPYEYIHTTIPFKKYCVSKYKPLSRAFFKLYEIIHFFGINIDKTSPIRTFHLAEGPGGFIEAVAKYRSTNFGCSSQDHYIGMTLLDATNRDYNIPAWKKSHHFLQTNPNVIIESGYDKTGNILSLDNLIYVNKMYGGTMDLITGDGGFDFSKDFDNQEVNMARLLFGQIAFAIVMQRQGGSFVLKIFDVFMQHSIDLVALLSSLYDQVYITKPNTSRIANSEKYLVCNGFLWNSSYKIFPFLYKTMRRMLETEQPIWRFLNCPIDHYFLNRLEESNVLIGQSQIENIFLTITYIIEDSCRSNQEVVGVGVDTEKDDTNDTWGGGDDTNRRYRFPVAKSKVYNIIKSNVQKCVQWCIQHNLSYNY